MRRSTRLQPAAHVERALLWFCLFSPEEQRAAIRRLADRGFSVELIATATHLQPDVVRQILGERDQPTGVRP